MSETTDNRQRVHSIVADRLQVDADSFDDETPLDGEVLDAESLDMVEIAEAIEADMGVHVPDEALEAAETVGELADFVVERA